VGLSAQNAKRNPAGPSPQPGNAAWRSATERYTIGVKSPPPPAPACWASTAAIGRRMAAL